MSFNVRMPDGTVIQNVPDGTTKDVIAQKYAEHSARANDSSTFGIPDPVLDLAHSAVSHAVVAPVMEGLASLDAKVTGKDPEAAKREAEAKYVYSTQNPQAQEATGALASAARPVVQNIKDTAEQARQGIDTAAGEVSPEFQAGVRKAGSVASDVLDTGSDIAGLLPLYGGAKGLTSMARGLGETRALGTAARAATENPVVGELRQRGVHFRPSDVAKLNPGSTPSTGARALEAAVGSPEAAQELSTHNITLYQKAAARAAGIDLKATNGVMPEEAFDKVSKPHKAVYGEMAALPGSGASTEFTADLNRIDTAGYGTQATADIEKLKSDFATPGNSQKMVNDVLALRKKASRLFQSDVPGADEVATGTKRVADAMENELERRAFTAAGKTGDYQLVNRFIKARQSLAKIHTVEDATRAGVIDPKKILKAKQNGAPVHLDEDLNFIAKGAQHAPEVSRHPMDFKNAGPGSHGVVSDLLHPARAVAAKFGGNKILKGAYQRSLGPEGIVPKAAEVPKPGKGIARVPGEPYPPQTPATPIGRMMPADEGQAPRGSTPGLPARLPGRNYTPPTPASLRLTERPQNAAVRQHPGSAPLMGNAPAELSLMGGAESPLPTPLSGVPKIMSQPPKLRRATTAAGGTVVHTKGKPITLAPHHKVPAIESGRRRGRDLAAILEGKRK